ncbi:MAG TPA: PAS domain S-box protein [Steroidobacteraceae bacterium]
MLSSDLVRSVLDSAPDAMIIIDSSGVILFANHQTSALFGYSREEIVGMDVEKLLPDRFRERHIAHRRNYFENVRVRPMGIGLDLYALRKDGTEFPVEISLSPIRQEECVLIAAAIRDVTAHKQAEKALKEAREAAERANTAKSRFLATASHDLRQPLQTLGLLNGTLRRMVRDPDCIEALAQQEQAINAMSRLLNALLDVSKLESGAIKPDVTDFQVATLFDELRAEFAGLASSKGLQLQVDRTAECARSDPALVGQVLRNLISNAIKYTHSGYVQLRCLRRQQALAIEVLDTGIGIAADQIPLIYEEFYQVARPNQSRDGYGLGLSIVQRIVKLLELKIDVRSEVGKGSVFTLTLPCATSSAAQETQTETAAPVPAAQSAATRHVLLVEDDPGVRNATRMLLKVEGYSVSTAASFDEALAQARGNQAIDLLITDYHLNDGKTGKEVISAVREIVGRDLNAILITGDTSLAIREMRCDAHLRLASKPINSDELLALVKSLLPVRQVA